MTRPHGHPQGLAPKIRVGPGLEPAVGPRNPGHGILEAKSDPREGTVEMKTPIRDLRRHLRYWSRQLRLQDWTLDIRLADAEEEKESLDGRYAACFVESRTKRADIIFPRIVKPAGIWDLRRADPETSLVHELLHVRFSFHCHNKGWEEVQEEVSIEALAEALVRQRWGMPR